MVRTKKLAEIGKKQEQMKDILRVGSSNIKNFITITYVPFENLLTKKWPFIYATCTSHRELSTSKVTFAVNRKECFMEIKI